MKDAIDLVSIDESMVVPMSAYLNIGSDIQIAGLIRIIFPAQAQVVSCLF